MDGHIRVLVADDQEILRTTYGLLAEHDPSLEIVGLARDGHEAVRMAEDTKADVALLDIKMPGLDGISAAKIIREKVPEMGVLLVSAYDEPEFVTEFLRVSPRAKGYLLKQTLGSLAELARAIHSVAEGRVVMDPAVVETLSRLNEKEGNSPVQALSPREREVLSLMARGYTNAGIAEMLHLETRTVENHVNRLLNKLGLPREPQYHARVMAVLTFLTGSRPIEQE